MAAFGWWGNIRLRRNIEEQLKAELTATLDANVTALQIWTTNQAKLAELLADEPTVRELSLGILEKTRDAEADGKRSSNSPEMEEWSNYLQPRLRRVGYEIAQLVNTNFLMVARSTRNRFGFVQRVSEAHLEKFAELFSSGQPVIITPFKPPRPPGRRPPPQDGGNGEPRSAGPPPSETHFGPPGTNDFPAPGDGPPPRDSWRSRRGNITLMQVAAPLRDSSGAVRGALALIINPDREFTRILSVARSGRSGETYAFDQHGLMISKSRFDDQLKKMGLIENRPEASSTLTLRLSDPAQSLPKGSNSEDMAATAPLIHIVAKAVEGQDGVDVEPSRDYRGVQVAGAWRWLPQLGFGVATQIDAAEAYQSLRVITLIFGSLCILLVLCGIGMFLFSYSNFVWRRRLSEAELKLKQLGQYTLQEKIGEGGMGVVYRARHALMRRDTAVKLLLPNRADPEAIKRFEREVCLTCQLTHPNTIQVYDYGNTPEGVFYYAMEFLSGVNLHELVARFGPQPEGRVIHILTQVCGSLAEAHALGLVHRDIKPANVFLCHRGGVPDCVKVLDFGLVREYNDTNHERTQTSLGKGAEGTPSFMPPEAIKNPARSDPRSDIYSMGALAYFLLTGEYVFDADSVLDLYEKHLTTSPMRPSARTENPISAELETAILRCLEKDAGSRPQSVFELRELLLANPQAAAWDLQARVAWWASYPGESRHQKRG